MTVVRVRVRVRGLVASAGSRRAVGWQRSWTEGKVLVLDDAFEHEVWNDGIEERVVLLFDLWHWELTPHEVSSIQAMFEEVEARRDARQQGGQQGAGPAES